MKSMIPDPNQLDELAAGLDAGWDTEPGEPSHSEPPHSTPLPATLDALDADWDAAPVKSPAGSVVNARSAQTRQSIARPAGPPASGGRVPLFVTKQERRDAERKRRAHQNQQKNENKKQRKAERQAEARRASEQLRLTEQQAIAERRAQQAPRRKRVAPRPEPSRAAPLAKQAPKRVQRTTEPSATSERFRPESPESRISAPLVVERGAKRLILPLLIAILVAVTLGFALSRAR